MALKVHWSGTAWHNVADGKAHLKWGSGWISPAFIKIKWGSGWVDSDYRGYPNSPSSLRVYAWDYDSCQVTWNAAPVGGAPISYYHIVMTDQAGNWIHQENSTDLLSPGWAVAKSTKYMFYVRAVSTGGLGSEVPNGWVGPLKVSIGKPAVTTYTTETATRAWSAAANVAGYRDALVGVAVPSSVVCTSVNYNVASQGGFTSVLSPWNNREIYRLANSGQQERFSWGNPVNSTVDVANYTGNGGITGFICRGIGWSSASSGPYKCNGTVTAYGTETYSYQQAHTTPAVANGYW